MKTMKKLIEVALPLEAINKACAREKSIRHGHPSTLHLWWARRPLAAARAVIFAQMVDDPSAYVDVLRADPKLHRKAESALKARLKLWEEAKALAKKAMASGLTVVEPGPQPTLDEMLADADSGQVGPAQARAGDQECDHQRVAVVPGAGMRRRRRLDGIHRAQRPVENLGRPAHAHLLGPRRSGAGGETIDQVAEPGPVGGGSEAAGHAMEIGDPVS